MNHRTILLTLLAGLAFASLTSHLRSQGLTSNDGVRDLEGVGIEQKLDQQVPLQLTFHDEQDRAVQMAQLVKDRPVILALVYYECPMLCTEILNGLLRGLRPLNFTVGNEFDVVAVSIDPGETATLAREKKVEHVKRYGREESAPGWHFLTGEEVEIVRLADSVGFSYRYDPSTDLYSHAAAIMLLTPDGRVSRYFLGIDYSPKDLKLGIMEASEGRVGSIVDQVLLFCYQYDPATGRYSLAIMTIVRTAGIFTVLALLGYMTLMLRKEKDSGPLPTTAFWTTIRSPRQGAERREE